MSLAERINNTYRSYQNKAYVRAEIDIRALLVENPNNTDALRLGALTALALNQVVTAHKRLMQACSHCEITAEMANTLGNILKASGEWSQAEEAYQKAIVLDPDYEPVRANLIDLFVQSGQPDRAVAEINSQSNRYGETDLMRLSRATALMNMGRYEQALEHSENIHLAYDCEKVANLKVRLFFHLGRYDEMKALAESIPATSVHAAETLAIVVNAYAMQNNVKVCQDIINAACSQKDATAAIFAKSVHQLTRIGFAEAAENLQVEGKMRFGAHPDIMSEKAHNLLKSGQAEASCRLFKDALSLRPADVSIMMKYAQACLVAGQYDLCQNLIHGALQQLPNNQFLFALAATLQRQCGIDYKQLYDYDNFIRVYDLEPPEGYETIEAYNADLKDCLDRYHSFKSAPLNQSLRGGTQTDIDLFFTDEPLLKMFFQSVDKPIRDYMDYIGYEDAHPLKCRNTGNYRINGAWSVHLSGKGHHVNHVHPMGWISSSYYVDVPSVVDEADDHQGWINFGQPSLPGLNMNAEKFIKPKPGRLVLFPSYMWHGTIPFSGDQARLTLPFDVVPA